MKAIFFIISILSLSNVFALDVYQCDYLEGIEEYYVRVEIDKNEQFSSAVFKVHQYSGEVSFEEHYGSTFTFSSYLGSEFKKTRVIFNERTKKVYVRTNIGNNFETIREAKYGCNKQ